MKVDTRQSLVGILAPAFALRTEDDLGVGDTEGVRQMIDLCHGHRVAFLQLLPINETDDQNSPYNTVSSRAIEPTTIAMSPRHLPDLSEKAFSAMATPAWVAELRRGRVNYSKVKALKRALLEAAFENFSRRHLDRETARGRSFRGFERANSRWLADYALFRVLMEEHRNSADWERWPPEHQTPAQARAWLRTLPEARRAALARRQRFFKYVQWIAASQWQALKRYAESNGVLLMGDVPFGVSRSSADVWANRALFDLDWSGGAPPEKYFRTDPFTRKWGQTWGIATYRWDELRRRDFDWWRARIAGVRKVFHLYRIDHVLGFFRIYSFPWTPDRNAEFLPLSRREAAKRTGGRLPGFKPFPDDTARHRAFNRRQGEEFLRVVLDASGNTTVVAEDLGLVPDYVPAALRKLGIPGYRIPAFVPEPNGTYADPRRYPRLSLTQPATHDHPPLAAAWADCWRAIEAGQNVEANRKELRRIMDFAGLTGEKPPHAFTDRLHEAYLRRVMQSNSWLVSVTITDVFAMTGRFNVPGTVSSKNWSWRLPVTVRQLDADPGRLEQVLRFTRLARDCGRTA